MNLEEAISQLARELPQAVVDALAARLELASEFDAALLARLEDVVRNAKLRDGLTAGIHEAARDPSLTPQALALVLRTAARVDAHHRGAQRLELAWTGPLPPSANLRRIDQALLERIPGAQKEVLIVTFAAWRPRQLEQALTALPSSVRINLVVETSEDSEGRYSEDPRQRLCPELVKRARIHVWPAEKRLELSDKSGKTRRGVLHAKCAVVDRRWLLVSSANFTDSAMHVNMEMGIAIEGGEMPGRVAEHFDRLIRAGCLRELV